MKNFLFIVGLMTFIGVSAESTRTGTFNFTFSDKDFSVKTIRGDTVSIVADKDSLYHVSFQSGNANPQLPIVDVQLLLPKDSEIESISFTTQENTFASGVVLNNGIQAIPTSNENSHKTSKSKAWYAPQVYTPNVIFNRNYHIGKYKLADLRIYPFKYDANRKTLSICQITLNVTYKTVEQSPVGKNLLDERQRRYIESIIYNPQDIAEFYSTPLIQQTSRNATYLPNKYFIVTADSLKSAFQPLADWKKDKGMVVETITIEDISRSVAVANDTGVYKIKHYLYNRLNSNSSLPDNTYL